MTTQTGLKAGDYFLVQGRWRVRKLTVLADDTLPVDRHADAGHTGASKAQTVTATAVDGVQQLRITMKSGIVPSSSRALAERKRICARAGTEPQRISSSARRMSNRTQGVRRQLAFDLRGAQPVHGGMRRKTALGKIVWTTDVASLIASPLLGRHQGERWSTAARRTRRSGTESTADGTQSPLSGGARAPDQLHAFHVMDFDPRTCL